MPPARAGGAQASIPPGGTIGILGGGQLGRMLSIAAAELGFRCHIFCPDDDAPAAAVAAAQTRADYDDEAALQAFARQVDVVTLEFENIPVETAAFIARLKPMRPGVGVLRVTQDRLLEKRFAQELGIGTAPFAAIERAADAAAAAAHLATPRAIVKTRRMGYDGKGQRAVDLAQGGAEAIASAFREMGERACIVEGFVPFRLEISVLVARGLDGAMASFVPVENRHKNHILDVSIAPARLSAPLTEKAEAIAQRLAEALDMIGLMAVEMFVTTDDEILMNEIAPRVHNSGHWTIEACLSSQFQQHIRAICGLPLGSPARHANALMRNLIGADLEAWPELLKDPLNKLHIYGKREIRPGRKMGHVTRLLPLGSGDELADF